MLVRCKNIPPIYTMYKNTYTLINNLSLIKLKSLPMKNLTSVSIVALFTFILFSCGNTPSAETIKLEKELDSIKRYNVVLGKYEIFKLELTGAGAGKDEAKRIADSSFSGAHPEFTGAEWNTK